MKKREISKEEQEIIQKRVKALVLNQREIVKNCLRYIDKIGYLLFDIGKNYDLIPPKMFGLSTGSFTFQEGDFDRNRYVRLTFEIDIPPSNIRDVTYIYYSVIFWDVPGIWRVKQIIALPIVEQLEFDFDGFDEWMNLGV